MDTWQNGGEPSYDHLAIDLNGSLGHNGHQAVQLSAAGPNVEDGQQHLLRVIWNAPTDTLDVHFDGSERLTYTRDVVSDLFGGASDVIYGFTAGTGAAHNLQYVCPTAACFGTSEAPLISVGDVEVTEGDSGTTPAHVPVTLSCPSDQPVTVEYATEDGPSGPGGAVAGQDYVAASGSLTFQPGETSKDLPIQVVGDTVGEPDEDFYVRLGAATGGEVRYDRGRVRVLTDDISIEPLAARVVEGNDGLEVHGLAVGLAAPAPTTVQVPWHTEAGSATEGVDYQAASGTLTFAAGSTEAVLGVSIVGDLEEEPDEDFYVVLEPPAGSRLQGGPVRFVIADDDHCAGLNLVENPGADLPLVGGEIPGWTEVVGSAWRPRTTDPLPQSGGAYFFPGAVAQGELDQVVDLGAFAAGIDRGDQAFVARGYLRSYDQDTSRIVVEWLASDGSVLVAVGLGSPRRPVGLAARRDGRRAARGHAGRADPPDQRPSLRLEQRRLLRLHRPRAARPAALPGLGHLRGGGLLGESPGGLLREPELPAAPGPRRWTTPRPTARRRRAPTTRRPSAPWPSRPARRSRRWRCRSTATPPPRADETFGLRLANPSGAILATAEATATIVDDESALSIADTTVRRGRRRGQHGALHRDSVARPGPGGPRGLRDLGRERPRGERLRRHLRDPGLPRPARRRRTTFPCPILGDTGRTRSTRPSALTLSNPVNASICRPPRRRAPIVEDDTTSRSPTWRWSRGTRGRSPARFELVLSSPSSRQVTVHWPPRTPWPSPAATTRRPRAPPRSRQGRPGPWSRSPFWATPRSRAARPSSCACSDAVNAQLDTTEATGFILDDDDCPSVDLLVNGGAEDAGRRRRAARLDRRAGRPVDAARRREPRALVGQAIFWPGNDARGRAGPGRRRLGLRPLHRRRNPAVPGGGLRPQPVRGPGRRPGPDRRPVPRLLEGPGPRRGRDPGGARSVLLGARLRPPHRPPGTRWVRVRLLARIDPAGSGDTRNDVYFDQVALALPGHAHRLCRAPDGDGGRRRNDRRQLRRPSELRRGRPRDRDLLDGRRRRPRRRGLRRHRAASSCTRPARPPTR